MIQQIQKLFKVTIIGILLILFSSTSYAFKADSCKYFPDCECKVETVNGVEKLYVDCSVKAIKQDDLDILLTMSDERVIPITLDYET